MMDEQAPDTKEEEVADIKEKFKKMYDDLDPIESLIWLKP
jgi:hypothetical protein